MGIFDKAKQTNAGKTAKKNEKPSIVITGTEFDENLKKFANLKKEVDEKTAEMKSAQSVVKEACVDKYCELYTSTKSNPGSITVKSETGANVMFLPTDKYITVDETQAGALKETYGDAIVEEKTVFSFNNEMLEKYQEVLADMIENSDKIAKDDKDKLIVAATSYSVAKGSIDKAITVGKDVKAFIGDIQPVFTMKNAKVE
jgi:hypothetical protein